MRLPLFCYKGHFSRRHMKVIPIFCYNTLRNFSYLIAGKDCIVCVDPFDADLILKYLKKNNLKLSYILNTHGHHDHIKGNEEILEQTQAKVLSLKEHQEIALSDTESLKAIDTPGHTMDHQCFIGIKNDKQQFVMAGDTLFNAGVGNCKNGGDKKTLYQTVLKMKQFFDDQAIIYPGHDYFHNNLEFIKSIHGLNKDQSKYYEKHIKAEQGNFPFLAFGVLKMINVFLKVTSEEEFLILRDKRDQW